jgi:hypothetical protein
MRYLSDVVGALHNKPMQPSGELHHPSTIPAGFPRLPHNQCLMVGPVIPAPLVYRER